jgi:hypothetical protein
MIDEAYTITHRVIEDHTTVEHNISVIPHEDLYSTINRIRPSFNDEIVIKITDKKNPVKDIEFPIEFWTEEELKLRTLIPSVYMDGRF